MRGVTLADITRAADQLLADGERPTIDGVRRILGTGSPGTVNTLLKQYYQTLPARLNLPAPIATAAAELYESVRGTALAELQSQRAELELNLRQGREKLALERREFEVERSAVHQRLADLSTDMDRLREQLKMSTTRLATAEKELATQTTRAATAEAQFRAAEDERERSHQKHQSELQRLREQAEGNERHFLARIEEQKAQFQRLVQDREREITAANKRATSLEAAASEASKLFASLRAELAAAQRDVVKHQEVASATENMLLRVQDQVAKDQAVRQADLERARNETKQLAASLEQHKRERDEAVREAARLEGRLAALQTQLDQAKSEIRRLQKAK